MIPAHSNIGYVRTYTTAFSKALKCCPTGGILQRGLSMITQSEMGASLLSI